MNRIKKILRNFCHCERSAAISFFVFSIIFLLLFLSTPKLLLFYDAPEYLRIISENSLLKSMSLGHQPIHPLFIGFLWLVTHSINSLVGSWQYSANLAALLFGLVSIISFYALCQQLLKKGLAILATLIFSLFPGAWIVNSNLLVESLLLTLFTINVITVINFIKQNSKKNAILFFFSVFLLVGAHIQTIFWLPAVFSLPFLFKLKIKRPQLAAILKLTLLAIITALIFYSLIFRLSNKEVLTSLQELFFGRTGELFQSDGISSILRSARNLALTILRGFGGLTPILIAYVLFRKRKEKSLVSGFLLLSLSLIICGSIWTGDFMIRRIVFAAPIFALVLVSYFQKKSFLIVLYLIPVMLSNLLLYNRFKTDMPFNQMKLLESKLPRGNVLVQTHYVRPFTDYPGEILWVGEDNLAKIDDYLKSGKRVFLDSQAVFAPYLLYVGNNLHITSLGKFGVSETSELFKKYSMDLIAVEDTGQRIFVYEIKLGTISKTSLASAVIASESDERGNLIKIISGKAKPGVPILVYSDKLSERIHRKRIDYGDIITWLWVIITNRREPLVWTYADKNGIFALPISNENYKGVHVRGEGVVLYQ